MMIGNLWKRNRSRSPNGSRLPQQQKEEEESYDTSVEIEY